MTTIDKVPFKVDLKVLVWAIGGAIIAAGLYWNMQANINRAQEISEENNAILKELQRERKENERLNDVRLRTIAGQLNTQELRITVLETIIKK